MQSGQAKTLEGQIKKICKDNGLWVETTTKEQPDLKYIELKIWIKIDEKR